MIKKRIKRFSFGKNWKNFSASINDRKIESAKRAICDFLKVSNLSDKSFLDIGSGSGLSSLAAWKLGAKVTSFDYDTDSVECTKLLQQKHSCDVDKWVVHQGSVLDRNFLNKLGKYDIVYSWGVLHHTGNMNASLNNVLLPMKNGGLLYIAIYNDQGWLSNYWLMIKKLDNINVLFKVILIFIYLPYFVIGRKLINAIRRKKNVRGMNYWHDMLDWLGGYPFEVATTEKIIEFFTERNCTLIKVNDCGRKMGCNEFLFQKHA